MIRIFLSKRFLASLSKLGARQREKASEVLSEVMNGFGNPHIHSGIGLRKLGPVEYECRLDIRLRIVMLRREEGLMVFDIMTHDQVRSWLKGR